MLLAVMLLANDDAGSGAAGRITDVRSDAGRSNANRATAGCGTAGGCTAGGCTAGRGAAGSGTISIGSVLVAVLLVVVWLFTLRSTFKSFKSVNHLTCKLSPLIVRSVKNL